LSDERASESRDFAEASAERDWFQVARYWVSSSCSSS